MEKPKKIKKWLCKKQEHKLIRWEYVLTNIDTWEIIEANIHKKKLFLSNNKQFMKMFTDRGLNIEISKKLRDVDLWFLFKIRSYIDEDNVINFTRLKKDFGYSDSKLSKARKPLVDNWIIKKSDWVWFLSPVIGIKTKEISQELIDIFNDEIQTYWITIK